MWNVVGYFDFMWFSEAFFSAILNLCVRTQGKMGFQKSLEKSKKNNKFKDPLQEQ